MTNACVALKAATISPVLIPKPPPSDHIKEHNGPIPSFDLQIKQWALAALFVPAPLRPPARGRKGRAARVYPTGFGTGYVPPRS